MAIATRTDINLASGFTQTSVIDAIKQGFLNAGFSHPIDDFTSGTDRILVYSQVVDASKVYGTNYLRLRFTSNLIPCQQLFTGWNVSTHIGTNGSGEHTHSGYGLNSSTPLTITSLNGGSEYNFVCLSQSGTFFLLGLLTPEKRPTWWDLNSFPYGFINTSYHYQHNWRTANISPYGTTEYHSPFINWDQMGNPNPITNKRDIVTGMLLFSTNYNGIAGKTSDDLTICYANGIAKNEVIQADGKQ